MGIIIKYDERGQPTYHIELGVRPIHRSSVPSRHTPSPWTHTGGCHSNGTPHDDDSWKVEARELFDKDSVTPQSTHKIWTINNALRPVAMHVFQDSGGKVYYICTCTSWRHASSTKNSTVNRSVLLDYIQHYYNSGFKVKESRCYGLNDFTTSPLWPTTKRSTALLPLQRGLRSQARSGFP